MIKQEIITLLKNTSWFINSSDDIKEELVNSIDDYKNFVMNLIQRPVSFGNYKTTRLLKLYPLGKKIVPVFEVETDKGEQLKYSYMSWAKGKYHSMRGILLVMTDNRITHFIIRKTIRFAVGGDHYESLGSIYPPTEVQNDTSFVASYIQDELQKIMDIPKLTLARYLDLGEIYPDAGMSDNVVKMFAAVTDVQNINEITTYTNNKLNIKDYDYTIEVVPIAELLNFLAKTNDSFLLAIFGRLQALNVIKL